MSDEWAAYRPILSIDVHPSYVHQTVNHSHNFVDPNTGACANNIELYWKKCNKKFKNVCGVHTTMLESHLDEFQLRQLHARSTGDYFTLALGHLAE